MNSLGLEKLGKWSDSSVFKIIWKDHIFKVYPHLSREQIEEYHAIQSRFAKSLATHPAISNGIKLDRDHKFIINGVSCNFNTIFFSILDLSQAIVLSWDTLPELKEQDITGIDQVDIPTITKIPYIWWDRLIEVDHYWSHIERTNNILCRDNNILPQHLTADNIKVHPIGEWEKKIMFVITDVWTSIQELLEGEKKENL